MEAMKLSAISLNPCFSGNRFGSFRDSLPVIINGEESLNPCFSGNRFGSTADIMFHDGTLIVLILVLVEIGLGDYEC